MAGDDSDVLVQECGGISGLPDLAVHLLIGHAEIK